MLDQGTVQNSQMRPWYRTARCLCAFSEEPIITRLSNFKRVFVNREAFLFIMLSVHHDALVQEHRYIGEKARVNCREIGFHSSEVKITAIYTYDKSI